MRRQLRAPLLKLLRLYFSFGEWDAVVVERAAADQERIHAKPRAERFSNRDRGLRSHDHGRFAPLGFERAAPVSKPTAGDSLKLTSASVGKRSSTKRRYPAMIFEDCCPGTSRKESFAEHDHRLGFGFLLITADDAVDLRGRPRPVSAPKRNPVSPAASLRPTLPRSRRRRNRARARTRELRGRGDEHRREFRDGRLAHRAPPTAPTARANGFFPECKSREGPADGDLGQNATAQKVVIAGVSASHWPVSQTSAISALSPCLARKGARLTLPDSSSPSISTLTSTGRAPRSRRAPPRFPGHQLAFVRRRARR